MAETYTSYTLTFHLVDGEEEKVEFNNDKEKLVVGSSPSVDLTFEEAGLAEYHALFRLKKGVITMHMLGPTESAHIGQYPLVKGKVYILEPGDFIRLGPIRAELKEQKVESEPGPKQELDEEEQTETESESEEEDSPTEIKTEIDKQLEDLDVDAPIPEVPESEEEQEKSEHPRVEELDIASLKSQDSDNEEDEDQEEEEEEEEEEEDEEVKRENLTVSKIISKAFQKKKRPHPHEEEDEDEDFDDELEDEQEDENDQIKAHELPLAGIFSRLMATLADLAIFTALWYGVFESLNLKSPLMSLITPVSDSSLFVAKNLVQQIPLQNIPIFGLVIYDFVHFLLSAETFLFLASFYLFQLCLNFIFGVSLTSVLMGITNTGPFISKRLKGLLRTGLTPLTFPILIPELSLILGKRTLREVLLKDRVYYRKGLFQKVGLPFIFPMVLAFALILPLAQELYFSHPKEEMRLNVDAHQLPREFHEILSSQQLGLTFKIEDTDQGDWLIFPQLPSEDQINKLEEVNRARLDIYSQGLNQEIQLELRKNFTPFQKLTDKIIENNPISQILYPELYLTNNDSELRFNSVNESEFLRVLEVATNYHRKDFQKVLTSHGPYIKGPLETYDNLLNLINLQPPLVIDWYSRASMSSGRNWIAPIIHVQSPQVQNEVLYLIETASRDWNIFRIYHDRESQPFANKWKELILNSLPYRTSLSQVAIQEANNPSNYRLNFSALQPTLEVFDLFHAPLDSVKDSNTFERAQSSQGLALSTIEKFYKEMALKVLDEDKEEISEKLTKKITNHINELYQMGLVYIEKLDETIIATQNLKQKDDGNDEVQQLQAKNEALLLRKQKFQDFLELMTPIYQALKQEDPSLLAPELELEFIDEPI